MQLQCILLASFFFGRPQNLPPSVQESFEVEITYDTLAWSGKAAFTAIYKGCNSIENIGQALRKGSMLDIPTAEQLLSQLRSWTDSLPNAVRHFNFEEVSSLEPEDRQSLVSSVHILCIYYFAVTLITWPLLIAYLMSRLCAIWDTYSQGLQM